MVNNKEAQNLAAKMNVIISLFMDMKEGLNRKLSTKEKVKYLVRHGLNDNKEIMQILDMSEKHVSKEKALVKKDGRK